MVSGNVRRNNLRDRRALMPPRSGYAAADRCAVDRQQDHRTDDGADEAGPLARLIPTDRLTEPGRDQGTGDAEQDSDDETSGIATGHEQLGDDSGQQADDDGSDDRQH